MSITRFLAAGLLAATLSATPPDAAETTVVRPKPIDDVLYNPGVGAELWNRSTGTKEPPNYPEVRLTYYRWDWSAVEPERGKIRWDIFDAALDDDVSTGARMGFRLNTVGGRGRGSYRGREGQMDVPEWLAEKAGGFWYAARGGDEEEEGEGGADSVFWPDYNNSVFLDEMDRLMTAPGERYADHPGLNHVDTSFFGCWGEQNTACVRGRVKPEHMWSAETYRRAIDFHFKAFPNIPILQLGKTDSVIYDYPMRVRGTGWRVDCFGDYGYYPRWNHMESYYPQILQRYGDAWKRGMVSFEICGDIAGWDKRGFDFDKIMDKALEWHATSIDLKACDIPEKWMPKLLQTIKYMGYYGSSTVQIVR